MAPLKSNAEGWKHVSRQGSGKDLKCKLCGKSFQGTLTRVVDHLLGRTGGPGGGVTACPNVTQEIKLRMEKEEGQSFAGKHMAVQKKQRIHEELSKRTSQSFSSSMSCMQSNACGSGTIASLWKPVQKQEVDDALADLFYSSAIPFNVARSPHFKNALQKVAEFGKGYTPPSSERLRTTLLKRSKDRVTEKMVDIKASWRVTGCTILSDGWSDMCQRSLINVLVYCPRGISFLKVVDPMNHKKTSEYIFKILDETILEVGEENVVQVVTDNATNCVGAGKLIMDKYPQIYWSPCAAHCLNLLLQDLAKFPWVFETIQRGRIITNFIRNHRLTLSIYRKHASNELLRPCDTRFAFFYIMLKRVLEEKLAISSVVCCNEWETSMLSTSSKGKHAEQIILNNNFWENAIKVQKICEPIVDVLRMVDGDTPCLGMLYEAMDRCKESIQKAFNDVEADYKETWDVIDVRWKMMHTPLHAAACYLEPRLFHIDRDSDCEVMSGLYEAINKFVPDYQVACTIRDQLRAFRAEEGPLFGQSAAKDDRPRLEGYKWWKSYGSSTPELQRFALRILSQGASASACERNWSCFDHIQSKKRNKLLSGKLGDLVYVHSNLQMFMSNMEKGSSSSQLQSVVEDLEDADDLDFPCDERSDDDDDLDEPSALDDLELF